MLLGNSLSPATFLANYWQRKPLYLPGSIDTTLPTLDADELAWLATLPDVESRLVFTVRTAAGIRYRIEHGPFAESDLNKLASEDWTLLVHDVDKHLPDFREYFAQVPFIPSWRIDDLMVSFAAPGGSVGPHKDNYDVFLCQDRGCREWRLSDDRSIPQDSTASGLSLLAPFDASVTHSCTNRDVLYLPPGLPHWGIAKDFCATYSIGMRAPSNLELAAGASRLYAPDSIEPVFDEADSVEIFYTDTDLQPGAAAGGRISPHSIRRIREQELLDRALTDRQLANILGSLITDPKAWLAPEMPSKREISAAYGYDQALSKHGMARIAWYGDTDPKIVFANGTGSAMPDSGEVFIRQLCEYGVVRQEAIQTLVDSQGGPDFFGWLLAQGVFDLDSSRQ